MDAIQRMTPRVQQVMAIAGEEMNNLGHDALDSRHVLLGILQEDHGVAGDILRRNGITVEAVRTAIVEEDKGTAPPLPDSSRVEYRSRPVQRRFGWRLFGGA
jgi:ATP-dependent Clp protease ATP-binding subunit ClpC